MQGKPVNMRLSGLWDAKKKRSTSRDAKRDPFCPSFFHPNQRPPPPWTQNACARHGSCRTLHSVVHFDTHSSMHATMAHHTRTPSSTVNARNAWAVLRLLPRSATAQSVPKKQQRKPPPCERSVRPLPPRFVAPLKRRTWMGGCSAVGEQWCRCWWSLGSAGKLD